MAELKHVKNKAAYLKQRIFWGGVFRENLLVKLLDRYFRSSIYRDWNLMKESPHFFNHRAGIFLTFFGGANYGIYAYYRGFFVSEIISNNDHLLDIGCGDGFFTKRFYAPKCSTIDALDIERSAIEAAKTYNSDKKINYYLSDAIEDKFPNPEYDIIVWDGAIGHFPAEAVVILLRKIKNALKSDGIFVGSESLGVEGHDHLQYFASIENLAELFRPIFKYVKLRSIKYEITGGYMREEAFWRCANDPEKMKNAEWMSFDS